MSDGARIVGLGHAVPERIVRNEDPVFHADPRALFARRFAGYEQRRWLAPDEDPVTLAALAAHRALEAAQVGPSSIGVLLGNLSVSRFTAPQDLFFLHERLGLPEHCAVLPLGDEFTTFVAALQLARDQRYPPGLRTLIVCGSSWSRHVSFDDPVAWSIGDGAGAAVIDAGEGAAGLHIGDSLWAQRTDLAGTLRMQRDAAGTPPRFVMEAEADPLFDGWAVQKPCELVERLLDANRVAKAEVTLISHQPTRQLMERWHERLRPCRYLDTLATFGNMTLASSLVTLSAKQAELETPYVVVLGLGLGVHTAAILLRRASSRRVSR